jgi:hypothetical protein
MKNTAKILVLVLTLALLTVGLVIGVAAEDEITYVDQVNKITEYRVAAGTTYLVYPNAAAFEADKADGVIDGTGAEAKTDTTFVAFSGFQPNGQYAYILTNDVAFPGTHPSTGTFLAAGNFTLDLGGHTTTLDRMVQFEAGALTIQNGTVNSTYPGNNFQPSGNNNNLTLRNLNFTNTVSGAAFYRGAPSTGAVHNPTLTIESCVITFGNGGDAQFIYVGENGKTNVKNLTVKISDSDITFNVRNSNNYLILDEYNNYFTNVYFKNTKFNTTAGCSAMSTDYATVNRINVYFDKNTVARSGMFRAENKGYTGYSAGLTYNVIDEFGDDWSFDTSKVYAAIYTNSDKTQPIATFYTDEIWAAALYSAPDNTYVELGSDVDFVFNANDAIYPAGNLTFNLNSFALTKVDEEGFNRDNRFGCGVAGKTVKFYNGKINWKETNLAYVDGSNVVFEDVDVTMAGNYLFDVRNGVLTLTGGSITMLNGTHGAFNVGESADKSCEVELRGTDVKNYDHVVLVSNRKESVTNVKVTIVANGSDVPEIECKYMFRTNCGGAVLPGTSTTVTVSDALIKNTEGIFTGNEFTTTDGSAFNGTYTFSNTKLAKYDDQLATVKYGEGERLMTLVGDATYNYVIDVPAPQQVFSTNLSLYSHFVMNVYVPTEGNNIVAINGVVLSEGADVVNGSYAIALPDIITPTTALDKVYFTVGYTDAEDGEGVYRNVKVNYSVYEYFKSYFNTYDDTEAGYILNKDAMVYIQAAYALNGKTGTAFDALIGEDYASDFAFDETKTEAPAGGVLTSATFDITSNNTVVLKFYVTEDVTIWVGVGNESYVATNSDEANCKEVSLRAYALSKNLTINVGGETVATYTYSLDAYYNRTVDGMTAEQEALVRALGAFAKSAQLYKQNTPQA